jgi:hypothetical protein
MTEPNKSLLGDDEIPTVTLDGKQWPIPPLSIKQNRKVVPIIARRLVAEDGPMTEEIMDDLAMVVFLGLQRGHKELTREEFDEMAISPTQLKDAVAVVTRQSFMFKPGKLEVNGVSAPLAQAAVPEVNSPTG